MNRQLKERLVGAIALVILAVIFIPIVFDERPKRAAITESNIPERIAIDVPPKIIPIPERKEESATPETARSPSLNHGQTHDQSHDGASEQARGAEANSVRDHDTPAVEAAGDDDQLMVFEKLISPERAETEQKKPVEHVYQSDERKESPVADDELSAWVVQIGSFSSLENAETLKKKLIAAGYPAFVEPLEQRGGNSYRVRVGPEIKRSKADALLKEMNDKMQLDGIVIAYP